jgi:hypothetical protein
LPATSNYLLGKARKPAAPITKKRFVKQVADGSDSVTPASVAGELCYGVALFSVSAAEVLKGKLVSVQAEGRAIVEASAAITEGQKVSTDSVGRAKVAVATEHVLGVCDEPATGIGNECSVLLQGPSIF